MFWGFCQKCTEMLRILSSKGIVQTETKAIYCDYGNQHFGTNQNQCSLVRYCED